jgi:hypothetical protein
MASSGTAGAKTATATGRDRTRMTATRVEILNDLLPRSRQLELRVELSQCVVQGEAS